MPTNQYTFNEYFPFSLTPSHILISTRHGGWTILSTEEYNAVKSNKLHQNSELFKNLEKAGIILTEGSVKKISRHLRTENSFLFSHPYYHSIAVTHKCNFDCLYCHPDASQKGEEMNINTAKKVLDFIFSVPLSTDVHILLEGGEPLLRWDLSKFIFKEARQRAAQKGLRIQFSLVTNLSLMTERIAKELAEVGMANLCVSFDGVREVHDEQRPFVGGEGSYDKVVYWINKLKKDYKMEPYALPVITNISLKRGPEALIDEYLKIGQNTVLFKPFRASGRALSDLKKLEMKAQDFFDFWKKGVEYCLSLNKKGIEVKELQAHYFINNIFSPRRISMCHRKPCGAGFSMLSYTPTGTICGCDAARGHGLLDLGHVDTANYQAVRVKVLSLLSIPPDLIPICSSCPFIAYCSHCLADTIGRENDFYPKIPRSFQCQWQKMAFTYLFEKLLEDKEDAKILRSWSKNKQC